MRERDADVALAEQLVVHPHQRRDRAVRVGVLDERRARQLLVGRVELHLDDFAKGAEGGAEVVLGRLVAEVHNVDHLRRRTDVTVRGSALHNKKRDDIKCEMNELTRKQRGKGEKEREKDEKGKKYHRISVDFHCAVVFGEFLVAGALFRKGNRQVLREGNAERLFMVHKAVEILYGILSGECWSNGKERN